jgi:hypothetical protein
MLSSAIIHRPLLYSSKIGALPRVYDLEISILLFGIQDSLGVAPELRMYF